MLPAFERLDLAGLGGDVLVRKQAAFERCLAALGPARTAVAVGLFVPGRIEVLGKHTDYGGGRSLLCVVEQGFVAAVRARADDRIVVHALDADDRFECRFDPAVEPRVGVWTNYPATVVRRLARNFPNARTGVDVAFTSDLPLAAGLSSSSALMIMVFAAIAWANRLDATDDYRASIDDRLALAAYAATIENGRSFRGLAGDRGVGTFGGSEDHTAILSCKPGILAQYAFGPLRFEREVALPEPWVLVVAGSGVIAEKTGAAMALYNRASRLAGDALAAWNIATGRSDVSLEHAVTSAPDGVERLLAAVRSAAHDEPEALVNRARQFCLESRELVPAGSEALAAGDLSAFDRVVERSQRAAEEWLGNQVPETIFLARSARECGAAAASSFGAGFGGSVWALVRRDGLDAFVAEWSRRYAVAFPEPATRAVYVPTRPGAAAFMLTPRTAP
jgi:galactokinase